MLPEKVRVTGLSASAEAFTSAIATMLLDRTTTTWSYGYDRFVEYYRQHGTGAVPSRHVDEATGFPLGQWVQAQRQAYRWGRLTPQQISQLEDDGFEWGQRSAQWRKHIALVQTLATGTESWMTTTDLCFLAPSLAGWFRSVQQRHDNRRLTASERGELSDLCAWGADPLDGIFDDHTDVNALVRILQKRGRLPRNHVSLNGRSIPAAQIKELLDLSARYALLTPEQRAALIEAGIDLPAVEADIDITQPGWEPTALRHLAVVTATAIATGWKATPRRGRRRPGSQVVSLASLVTGPHGYWKRTRMAEDPEARHGFDDVLPGASELVEDAESRVGRDDAFVVRADSSVWRRPGGTDEWTLAGRLRDHVDAIVAVLTANPDADGQEPMTVVLDDGVGNELPHDLASATTKAVNDALLPHPSTLGAHLLKSYGVKRAHIFATHDEADEFIARAHRRGQQPAWITDQISTDTTTAMHDIQTKILRESLALTVPKVAAAYREGRLDGWPKQRR